MKKLNICVCGGGALGQVISGKLSAEGKANISVLTNRPEKWIKNIVVDDFDKLGLVGDIKQISNNPADVIPNVDIVILTVPGELNSEWLTKIRPYLSESTIVSSVVGCTGFMWIANSILGNKRPLMIWQRVPCNGRVDDYGKKATLTGRKTILKISAKNIENIEAIRAYIEFCFDVPTVILPNYLEATLTNSNPILHPCRLYSAFGKWESGEFYDKNIMLYDDWTLHSSELLVKCDVEFQEVLSKLPIDTGQTPPILQYYESGDYDGLRKKLMSIPSFQRVKIPMHKMDEGFIPDVSGRFFHEDIPFGLVIIKGVAELCGVETPNIDKVIEWGQTMIGKEFIVGTKLIGKNIKDSGIPQNYGIDSVEKLVSL